MVPIVVVHYTVPAFACKAVNRVESHSQLVRAALNITLLDLFSFPAFFKL